MRRAGACCVAALGALLLSAAATAAASLEIQRADFSVQLDPRFQSLYATVVLNLRNADAGPVDIAEFELPAPLGSEARVLSVWDRDGQLEWRADPAEVGAPLELLVALRRPLSPGKKLVVGLRYELNLAEPSAESPARVNANGARLATSGWYPVPARAAHPLPRILRLDVRLPKEWNVRSPAALKRRRTGATLSQYALELTVVEPGKELLRAEAPTGKGLKEQ